MIEDIKERIEDTVLTMESNMCLAALFNFKKLKPLAGEHSLLKGLRELIEKNLNDLIESGHIEAYSIPRGK